MLLCGIVSLWAVAAAHGAVETPVVITQVPAQAAAQQDESGCHSPAGQLVADGARLLLVTPQGAVRVLSEGFHSAADPAISSDAKRMVFAGKRASTDPWNIFEMELESLGVRQITRDCGNCRQPCYQSTLFTLDSPEPWYQLTFVSDMAGTVNEIGCGPSHSLYSCKLDGTAVRRLTYNLSDDADPFQMLDGRVLYASWQRSTLQRGLAGRVQLFGINLDGTDHALYADARGEAVKRMPCITDRGLVLFIESELGGDGAGQIAAVTFRRPLRTYHPITTRDEGYVYRYPSPTSGGRVLVSRRPRDGSQNYGVWLFDPQTKSAEVVLDDPQYDEAQARAVRVEPVADGRSSVVDEEKYQTGKFYCLNSNWDDFPDRSWHPPGTARRVRLLEGVPLASGATDEYLPVGDGADRLPGATVHGLPPLVQRRVLGEVDISPDGSFHVEVPANTAIQLQTLDENGVALRACGWIWTKNREWRGCIGCHEDGELTPENVMTDSLRTRAMALTLPPERRRTVDFRRDLMPVIEAKCVPCHGAAGAAPRLDGGLDPVTPADGPALFNQAYLSLLARQPGADQPPDRGRYVDPGRARTSRLIWHVYGRNLARPWDGDRQQEDAQPIPEGGPALTDLERRLFAQWVDMGALWNGVPVDTQP